MNYKSNLVCLCLVSLLISVSMHPVANPKTIRNLHKRQGNDDDGSGRDDDEEAEEGEILDGFNIEDVAVAGILEVPEEEEEEEEDVETIELEDFADFCAGEGVDVLSDGSQQPDINTCSQTIQGVLPTIDKMVSSTILSPKIMQDFEEDEDIEIRVALRGMNLGVFDNPDVAYYKVPQRLDSDGFIIGHTHAVVQTVTGEGDVLDPEVFEFFDGLDQQPNADNELASTVEGGLPAGTYRVCTMSGASAHTPVLMPVAQRGAQDDCKYFTVGGGGNNNNDNDEEEEEELNNNEEEEEEEEDNNDDEEEEEEEAENLEAEDCDDDE